jgi:hypothetical protein
MSRRRAVVSAVVLVASIGAAGAALLLLSHVPPYYEARLQKTASPELLHDRAKRFVQNALQLADPARQNADWSEEFTEEMINAWLAEDLPRNFAEFLPPEVNQPRVQVTRDEVRLAFQARRGAWSGVIDARLRGWVSGPREVSIEVVSLRAGLVPVPAEELLTLLVNSLRSRGWRVDWKGSTRGDVLVVQLDQGSAPRPGERSAPALESIELAHGAIRISGRRASEIARRDRVEGK